MTKPSNWVRTVVGLLVLVVLAAPLVLVVSIYGTRMGLFDMATGYGNIGMKLVPVLSWIGLAAAILACLLILRDRRVWALSLGGLVIAGLMAGGSLYQSRGWFEAPRDVTTNVQDPPVFAGRMAQDRRNAGAPEHQPQACEGFDPVESQMAYESVAWALDKAGVTVMGASFFRVDGWTEGFFYGVQHDVTVRIRPGRTDVRVTGRDGLPIGDQACDLGRNIVAAMHEALRAQ